MQYRPKHTRVLSGGPYKPVQTRLWHVGALAVLGLLLWACVSVSAVAGAPAHVPVQAATHDRRLPEPHAKFYERPGLMRQVALNRGLVPVRRMASTPDCGRIGRWFAARVNGHIGIFKQVDCSAPKDRARHLRQRLVLEVDYYTARDFGFRREGHAPAQILRWYNW